MVLFLTGKGGQMASMTCSKGHVRRGEKKMPVKSEMRVSENSAFKRWLVGGGVMVVSKRVQKKYVGHGDGLVLQPLLLTIPETAVSLRLSRAKVYQLIDFEDLPVVRFGRAVRVSAKALEQWIERREQGA